MAGKGSDRLARVVAYVCTAVPLVLSVWVVAWFDPGFGRADGNGGLQFIEHVVWVRSFNIEYFMGVDGVSIAMLLLTSLVSFVGVIVSESVTKQVQGYFAMYLLLVTGMFGVFVSMDFFLFYVFWELMLLPMYFLIGIWGGPRKEYAAIKFFLYTLLGSILMLIALILLYYEAEPTLLVDGTAASHPFNMLEMMLHPYDESSLVVLGMPMHKLCWVMLFVGFAIKVPMFPFHTWLPDAHTEAPTAGSVILAGVLLKMGTYGFVRFNLPMLPEATRLYAPYVLALAVVGIVYGALVAMVQRDWKKLVAYSSVSHLGFCMLGVFALNVNGLNGGILQMLNHGLSTGALFLIVGIVYERRHTRLISEFGGLSKQMPIFATLFMIVTMSSIGLPALNGFIGEFTILAGAFQIPSSVSLSVLGWTLGGKFWAVCGVSGIVLGAAYMLWLYQRTMFGPLENPENQKMADCNAREVLYLAPIVALCIWIGLYPKPFFDILDKPVARLVQQLEARPQGGIAEAAPPPAAAPGTEQGEAR